MRTKTRLIAFYLPQYHPIPENDEWWGKGFTEWRVVANARPLFKGHKQPRLPGELGFYDLRIPEVREQQAELARFHGIEGFCYWHYWLGSGRRLLERPFNEVLSSGSPKFPFCLGWANHSWYGRFLGAGGRMLVEQTYPSQQDHLDHFEYLLRAFSDERYILVEGKPLLYIFNPLQIPRVEYLIDQWQAMAIKNGLKGLHIVGRNLDRATAKKLGLDAYTYCAGRALAQVKRESSNPIIKQYFHKWSKMPYKISYEKLINTWHPLGPAPLEGYPDVLSNWDNTPRMSVNGEVLMGCSPELFSVHLTDVANKVMHKPFDRRIIFLKSWNEWAEGNYVEPDLENGRAYLMAINEANSNENNVC